MTLSITFYNNVKYTKDDFMNRDRDFFGNGVVKATDFPLTFPQTPDLTFQVGAGVAWVDGYRIANDAATLTLAVQNGSALPRIDIVQIGHDDLNSKAVVAIKQGVAAASPIEPGPDAGFIKLYAISVAANATTIAASAVTDRRTLVPLNISGTQINFSGAASTTTNTFTGTQTAPSYVATSQTAPLALPNLTALPTSVPIAGTISVVNGKWYQSNGTAWNPMTDPVATTSTVGSIKVGTGLTVATDGTLTATSTSVGAVNKAGDTMTGNLNAPTLTSTVATGTAPLTVTSTTKVTNLNADQLDGYHAGNASGQIPVSNSTVNTALNADLVDGYHAGNATGQVAVNNGTLNVSLNADQVDGYHAGNAAGHLPISNGTVNATLNSDMVDGYHAGNLAGQVAVNNGTLNTSLNADLLDGLHADNLLGQRIQNAAPSNDLYTFVATLPVSGTTTFDKLVIELQGGPSYGSDALTYDWVLLGNHGGFNYQYMQKGVDPNSTRSNFRVVAYTQTDGSVNVYLRALKAVNTAMIVRTYGMNVGNNSPTATTSIALGAPSTTAPSGTVVFDSAVQLPNVSITAGTLTATSQTAPLKLPLLTALPASSGAAGTICIVNGKWYLSDGSTWNAMNADLLDGYHAGNATGQVPISNGTVNATLNADLLDGYHAGNAAGQVPVNNGTLNASLNADLLDGLQADDMNGQRLQITAPASDQYYFVATLPISSAATYDKLVIEMQGGPSTGSDALTNDWVMMSNHGGFNYQYMQQGADPNLTRRNFRVMAYGQADGSVNVYLRAMSGSSSSVIVRAYGINAGNTATTAIKIGAPSSTAPTGGTVQFDSAVHPVNASLTAGTLSAVSKTAALKLPILTALPTVGAAGTICMVNNLWYQSNGTAWVPMYPDLQPATTTTLGSVKAGAGINVAADGTIDINTTVLEPFRMDQLNFINLALEVETMKRASLNGVTANIFIESFVDLNDISLLHGTYDATNQKVYLP